MDNTRSQQDHIATPPNSAATSQLNKFILDQLNEKRTNGELVASNGFVVPKLQLGNQTPGTKFVIPLLKRNPTEDVTNKTTEVGVSPTDVTVSQISHAINKLKLQNNENVSETNTPAIDLTAALSSSSVASAPDISTRNRAPAAAAEVFEIPFIECDREVKVTSIPTVNEYCQLNADIAQLDRRKCLVAPSPCGRVLCLSYRLMRPLPYIKHSFKVKHKIQRFRFDTQSPDDIVIAKLSKFQRQS